MSEALLAPVMAVPFLRHWKVGEPLAATVRVAVPPTAALTLAGCDGWRAP